MRSLPTGVSILAASDAHGRPVGLTVNAVASVSLRPPILLVCIHQRARMRSLLRVGMPLVVNVLSSGQADLARRFASSTEDRFAGVAHQVRRSGHVMITGAVAHVLCSVREIVEVGDHSVVFADVTGGDAHDGSPLVFCEQGYTAAGGVRQASD
ncbi:MAG TPA: flavin reductase family protein [Gemmatimonadaceae bacterium]